MKVVHSYNRLSKLPLLQSLASELVMFHLSSPSLLAVAAAAAKHVPQRQTA